MKNLFSYLFLFLLIILLMRACDKPNDSSPLIEDSNPKEKSTNHKIIKPKSNEIVEEKKLSAEDKWHEITGEDIDR